MKNCLWANLQDVFLNNINLLFRGRRPEDITRLKSALTNGYTVAKEKKYRVVAPKSWRGDSDRPVYMYHDYDGISSVYDFDTDDDNGLFTQKQLEQYNLTSDLFKKEEVTDDDD